jgi:hypothetical protein
VVPATVSAKTIEVYHVRGTTTMADFYMYQPNPTDPNCGLSTSALIQLNTDVVKVAPGAPERSHQMTLVYQTFDSCSFSFQSAYTTTLDVEFRQIGTVWARLRANMILFEEVNRRDLPVSLDLSWESTASPEFASEQVRETVGNTTIISVYRGWVASAVTSGTARFDGIAVPARTDVPAIFLRNEGTTITIEHG